jgi:large subunit ribosomal protein L31/Ran GTPase-activating protein 1
MAEATWALSEQERNETVERVVANISTLSFFSGKALTAEEAHRAAVAIERRAYTAAQVAARTTTGTRPAAETTSSYARWALG